MPILDPDAIRAMLSATQAQRVLTDYGRVVAHKGEATLCVANGSRVLIRLAGYGARAKFARPPYKRPELRALRAFLRDFGGYVFTTTRREQRLILQPMTKVANPTAYCLMDNETKARHPIDPKHNHTVILHEARAARSELEGVLF